MVQLKISDINPQPNSQVERVYRALYLRRVPEDLWQRVHIRAIEHRLSLQDYLVALLTQALSLPPAEDSLPTPQSEMTINAESLTLPTKNL
ncbi:MAG: hypothetical protein K8U57_04100 [Planctomycetes bacterium]|nr:hypothetical protein [Planctomycetota bacterium]